jgi:WD40 repeat protein
MSKPNEAEKKFKYDVFLSHSSKDKPLVRELAERLKADGVRVWFDEWEIQIGDPILSKIEQGLEESRILILAMSANAFGSDWVSLERGTAIFRDPQNKQRRFIPLRLDDSEIKETLKQFRYVDWRKKDEEEYHRLSAACLPLPELSQKSFESKKAETISAIRVLEGSHSTVENLTITADGELIVSGSVDSKVRVWETATGKCLSILEGHTGTVTGIAVTADKELIVSGSSDKTIRVWETATGKCLSILEGHTDSITGIAIIPNGKLIVSTAWDSKVRVWETATGKCLSILEGHTDSIYGVAITPDGKLIVSGSKDSTIRVWDSSDLKRIQEQVITTRTAQTENQEQAREHYTNAKILLVGESGVGKSGLACRLTEDRFVETLSTDGVWATQLKLPDNVNTEDTEREIWLWDFTGQSDYRLIHQLFMDETSLAVLVFNPQSDNPFEGLGQWDRDLQRAARRPFNKLLVAGRCDRGELTVSQKSIDEFISHRGFAGYLRTSALTGENCEELRRAIIENINWNDIPHRTSPRIFKLLKDEIIRLKDEGKVLLRVAELKQQLEMRLPEERFEIEELRAVVGLLAGSGVVWELEFGDFVLLQPERINSYAAAVIRTVRSHVDEMGYILEEDVLAGNLKFEDLKRLPRDEEEVVLRAMLQIFVKRGLCLRELTAAGILLIFPSYFKRDRPEQTEHPADYVTYRFSGALDEIYATLVVRLHHTSIFEKKQLWRYAADFTTTVGGKTVGLKMEKKQEGAAEIVVYLEPDIEDAIKVIFIRFIHDFLKAKDHELLRDRHYVCPHCLEPVENRRAVRIRLEKGLKDLPCAICEERVPLWDSIEKMFGSEQIKAKVRYLDEKSRLATDNESKEMLLEAHARFVTAEAGQIYRGYTNSDWGIDGEIEFKDYEGRASGKRVYLQLKSGDSHLRKRKRDETEIFDIEPRHAEYWQSQAYSVMLVVRSSDGETRWMNVTDYLKKHESDVRQIVFEGEPFVWQNVIKLRDKLIPPPMTVSK